MYESGAGCHVSRACSPPTDFSPAARDVVAFTFSLHPKTPPSPHGDADIDDLASTHTQHTKDIHPSYSFKTTTTTKYICKLQIIYALKRYSLKHLHHPVLSCHLTSFLMGHGKATSPSDRQSLSLPRKPAAKENEQHQTCTRHTNIRNVCIAFY